MNDGVLRCETQEKLDKAIMTLLKLPKKILAEFVITGELLIPYNNQFDLNNYIKEIQLKLDFIEARRLLDLIAKNVELGKKYSKEENYTEVWKNHLEWDKLNSALEKVSKRIDKNLF